MPHDSAHCPGLEGHTPVNWSTPTGCVVMRKGDINRMLNPDTVAVIGATEKEGSVGRTLLKISTRGLFKESYFSLIPEERRLSAFSATPPFQMFPPMWTWLSLRLLHPRSLRWYKPAVKPKWRGSSSSLPASEKWEKKGRNWRTKSGHQRNIRCEDYWPELSGNHSAFDRP